MDRAYLMVLVAHDTWKIVKKGTYDDCSKYAFDIEDDTISWMIVRPAREHFGMESFTITGQ